MGCNTISTLPAHNKNPIFKAQSPVFYDPWTGVPRFDPVTGCYAWLWLRSILSEVCILVRYPDFLWDHADICAEL